MVTEPRNPRNWVPETGSKTHLGVVVYEAPVLCLIVEGLPALEGQVEATAVHQGYLHLLP